MMGGETWNVCSREALQDLMKQGRRAEAPKCMKRRPVGLRSAVGNALGVIVFMTLVGYDGRAGKRAEGHVVPSVADARPCQPACNLARSTNLSS